jgi:hypothetical protein
MMVLLLSVLLILAALVLFLRNAKRASVIRLVDKIPGPPSYPLVGSELPMVLAQRNSKSNYEISPFSCAEWDILRRCRSLSLRETATALCWQFTSTVFVYFVHPKLFVPVTTTVHD